eukprot:CAMPEP_0118910564 /NCGR_PEP_ID=MMETSP1166-20130328/12651_1 /TAXON_ID=1104430 /ORGANISM="Chrysoreinhardia sp, Strain CCMP3193" /LENGTH=152 /DNA_ID=CAMNT_0006850031 /DNA_START=55 /DNA_END=513 /DNA_ORIENTATION=+
MGETTDITTPPRQPPRLITVDRKASSNTQDGGGTDDDRDSISSLATEPDGSAASVSASVSASSVSASVSAASASAASLKKKIQGQGRRHRRRSFDDVMVKRRLPVVFPVLAQNTNLDDLPEVPTKRTGNDDLVRLSALAALRESHTAHERLP